MLHRMARRQPVSLYFCYLTAAPAPRPRATAAAARQLPALGAAGAKHRAAVLGIAPPVVLRVPLVVQRNSIALATGLESLD